MSLITIFPGQRLAVVPDGTYAEKVDVEEETKDKGKVMVKRDALIVPSKTRLPTNPTNREEIEKPHLHISSNKNLGVLFCVVLLLVIAITNIPLRGLWSVIVIVTVIATIIILALMEWLDKILYYLSFLDIRINAAGYFWIALPLFVLWLLVMILFDRQIYMIFSPGQMRVRQEIGEAEIAFDTTGMTVQKQRSDIFRHWILGLGSGDLIVRTSGANPQEFHMNNVLFIGRKVKEIESMLRERQVVAGHN
jgi:hypothetical protein